MELIISHSNCDFDSFASMIAASLLHPKANICLVGSPDTNLKHFLDSYKPDFNFIKEKNVNPEEIKKLIIVDNRDPNRMGKIGQYLLDVFKPDSDGKKQPIQAPTIICYDHHPDSDNDIFNDYSHTEPTGACTTIMLDLLNRAGIQITPFQASIFALGIYEDTGSFLHVNTTYKDFAAVSYLFTVGASLEIIKQYLPKDFTSEQFEIINQMISQLETVIIKGISVSFIVMEFKNYHDDIAMLLQTVKRSKDLKLVFCLLTRSDKVEIIGRNDYDFIHIDELFRHFQGGGHKSAGFASVSLEIKKETKTHSELIKSVDPIKNKLIEKLDEQISQYGTVADLMTSPADTVSPDTSLQEVRNLLINNNYSTMLVAENGIVTGILTKKDISKALHHKMGSLTVESCMSVNVITVRDNESIYNAYKTLVDMNIGRLPVVDEQGYLKGIITRSDLLIHHFNFLTTQRLSKATFDNVKPLITKNIDKELIEVLKQAGHIADVLEMNAYVVGGFVRDLFLQQRNYDLDIVVEGDGLVYADEYRKKFGKAIKKFPKFGTAFVVLKSGKKVDITSARSEYYPFAGSLPEVAFSRIQNDLYRRDFSINSMAIQINARHFGKLLDFYGGRRDLRLGIIRVLNNFSFVEDPIRILRAIRFEQRFTFTIENKTSHLLRKSLQLLSLKNVSAERIKAELIYSSKKGPVDKFFARLESLGILNQINNNLSFTSESKAVCQKIRDLVIWFHNSFPMEYIDYWMCYHLALINGLSLRIKEKFAVTLKYPASFIDAVRKTDQYIRNTLPLLDKIDDEGQIALQLQKINIESIIFIAAVTTNKKSKEKMIKYLTVNRFVKPELTGDDIMELGVEQGKKVGLIINELRKGKINKTLKDKEAEINLVKRMLS